MLDLVLVLAFTWWLVRPLFKAKYIDRFHSIESTFIADGRFLKDHWPHPRWQPLWYCGTRFDYIYPPALRYGTALAARIWIPAKAYHVYTALLYCLGIAGVYLLIRVVSGSRGAALLGAVCAALVSPSYLFLKVARIDAMHMAPLRLWVLLQYGEGPHMSALAMLPFALGCGWFGLRERRRLALAGAAVFSAAVVSHNFYGATALAMSFPVMVWAVWITNGDRRVWLRAAAITALAYGLTAFWLTPSYLRVTLENMKYVSEPGNAWSAVVAAAAIAAYCLASYRLARRKPERAYPVFLAGLLLVFAGNVLGNAWFNFRVIGEPSRLAPELDMVLIMAAAEVLRRIWNLGRVGKACATAAVLATAWSALPYLLHARSLYPLKGDYTRRIEYRVTDWLAHNMPQGRFFAAGSTRFWFDAWHDLAQLGGGSEQGMLNPRVAEAQWHITPGNPVAESVEWMQAMGIDAVIVHSKNSTEEYHDFERPEKFAGALPVLWDSGAGDVIYRVPRRYPGLARVVDRRRFGAAHDLAGYVDALERGPDAPAATSWSGTDELRVRAPVSAGQAVLVQVSYDPAWRAYAGQTRLHIEKDSMGFMLIEAPPGARDLRLAFELPLENAAGRVLTALALAAVVMLAVRR